MRKTIHFLVLSMIFTLISSSCSSDNPASKGDSFPDVPESYILSPDTKPATSLAGRGTYESPYLIRNAMDFKYFIDKINDGSLKPIDKDDIYSGRLFVSLKHDIEISDKYMWIPINVPTSTSLDLNGENHTISGTMRMVKTCIINDTSLAGLFGRAESISLANINISANLIYKALSPTHRHFFAGIVAAHTISSHITDVSVTGKMTIETTYGFLVTGLGGISGYAVNTSYEGCKTHGSIEIVGYPGEKRFSMGKSLYLGGLTGYSIDQAYCEGYTNCSNYSEIKLENLSVSEIAVGGLIGYRNSPDLLPDGFKLNENHGNIIINDISWHSTTDSDARAIYAGGFYGWGAECGSAEKSWNYGDITVSNVAMPAYIGGLGGLMAWGDTAYGNNSGNITNNAKSGYTGGCYGKLISGHAAEGLGNSGNVTSTITINADEADGWDDFFGATGGIAGTSVGLIKNSVNSGNITTPPPFIYMYCETSYGGAITGRGAALDCVNHGSVNGSKPDSFGIENGFTWLAMQEIESGKMDKDSPGWQWWRWYIYDIN